MASSAVAEPSDAAGATTTTLDATSGATATIVASSASPGIAEAAVAVPMNSKTVSINTHRGDGDPQMPRSKTFVTMVSNEPWLLHATTGQRNCWSSPFGRTTLLVDQSPFHRNEAGSKACTTLALQGVVTAPLLDNRAASRERFSPNSITYSCEERVKRALPGFELTFKVEGTVLEPTLQRYVADKHLVTAVAGTSVLYKEHDIWNFVEARQEE